MPEPHFAIEPDGTAFWTDWTDDDDGPTQEEFKEFVSEHRSDIKSLEITLESIYSEPLLNFRDAGPFPQLTSLYLRGVHMTALSFFGSDMPKLESLFVSLPSGPCEAPVRVDFGLPELRHLTIEHCVLAQPSDIGLCLTRCPKLETFISYKFSIYGPNYMVLPNCTKFVLSRSECTKSVEILSAPKLTHVNLGSSFSMTRFRVWDWNKEITPKEVQQLNAARKYGPKRVRILREKLMKRLLSRPDLYDLSSLPQCTVYHCGVELSEDSKAEAEGTRIHLTEESDRVYYGSGLCLLGNFGNGVNCVRIPTQELA
ncbi:hypothetical protein FGB62_50g226 [Gracilaria domingensis]|nr:hypothetical protein FGB62_50g226 [Gracilaria domingensis]